MSSVFTKRLLREWKAISARNSSEPSLYVLQPQDSNLHIWHLVITNPATAEEIYLQFFISFEDSSRITADSSPVVVLRCLTPNSLLPINRNIVLPQVGRTIVKGGMSVFVMNLWHSFFSIGASINATGTGPSKLDPRLSRAWNRVICRSFKHYFPDLVGTLRAGDYRTIKAYSKWIRNNDSQLSKSAMNQSMHMFREHIRNASILQQTHYNDVNGTFPAAMQNKSADVASSFSYDCDNLGCTTSAYPFEMTSKFNLGTIMNSIEDTANTASNQYDVDIENMHDDSTPSYKRHKH